MGEWLLEAEARSVRACARRARYKLSALFWKAMEQNQKECGCIAWCLRCIAFVELINDDYCYCGRYFFLDERSTTCFPHLQSELALAKSKSSVYSKYPSRAR